MVSLERDKGETRQKQERYLYAINKRRRSVRKSVPPSRALSAAFLSGAFPANNRDHWPFWPLLRGPALPAALLGCSNSAELLSLISMAMSL